MIHTYIRLFLVVSAAALVPFLAEAVFAWWRKRLEI